MVCALAALTAGLAWAANSPFPLAVMQQVGLAYRRSLRGVTWEVHLDSRDGRDYVLLAVGEMSAHLRWHRYHREAPGPRWDSRQFLDGPWPAGIQTKTQARPIKYRLADGSTVESWSWSMVFLELPLWGLCPVLGAYPTLVLFRGPIRRRGLCLKCGYDVRLLTEPRCPECWTSTGNK